MQLLGLIFVPILMHYSKIYTQCLYTMSSFHCDRLKLSRALSELHVVLSWP